MEILCPPSCPVFFLLLYIPFLGRPCDTAGSPVFLLQNLAPIQNLTSPFCQNCVASKDLNLLHDRFSQFLWTPSLHRFVNGR
ncbi:hypothetical protein DFH08DRAFT_905945 [Mycena albidolilacea]|uniref:Secreted protein n=1 Tax=Mycena albidolilacea TaxID=1033008 RepID=A0AAD6YZ47_9AGAR|nr:hypothetical protein DFH08DRAFT_905945 [Mycena albidolilacea]